MADPLVVDINKAHAIEGGLSFDDEAGIFMGRDDPTDTDVGDITKAPMGSVYIRNNDPPGIQTIGIWQRYGPGPYDWRSVFDASSGTGQPVQMFWAEAVVNKLDWFSVSNITGEFAGYIWPFGVTAQQLIIQTQAVTSTPSQNIDLYLNGVYDRTLLTLPNSSSETIYFEPNLNIFIPGQTTIQLRAGESGGRVQSVLVNLLVVR